jgi:ABC-type transport system substrate-binding protein
MSKTCWKSIAVIVICVASFSPHVAAQAGGELKFCLRMEPKTFDPLKVEDEASAAIRYLTGGVLVRVNRQTQELEPELAQSWNVSKDGRSRSACAVEFHFPMAHRLRPKTLPIPFSN